MTAITEATAAMREAEDRLRELVSKAAKEGDYSSVVQVAAWAQGINDLLDTKPTVTANASHAIAAVPKIKKRRRTNHAVRLLSRPVDENNYPRFFRDASQLIRIAWSRRERKEYLHKAPVKVFKAFTGVVADAGKEGRIFSTDDLLPITDDDGRSVPNYQAYVILALLKHTGLIEQHGRQGYSIPKCDQFRATVESVWNKLPENPIPRKPK